MLNKEILRSKWKEFKLSAYLLNRNLLTRISMIVLLLLILSAIFAPMLSPYPEDAINATHPEIALQAPSAAHIFGTDELGRDILSKTIYGIRISLSSALITVFFAMVVGTLLGAIAGSVGGILDEIIMRITDVFLSFPSLLLAIVIAAFLGPSADGYGNFLVALVHAYYAGRGNFHQRKTIYQGCGHDWNTKADFNF